MCRAPQACSIDAVHVIVVGCGRVGSGLAVELTDAGHSVAIIDKLSRSFRRLPADWPGQRIVGYGFDRDHLEEAGARRGNGPRGSHER